MNLLAAERAALLRMTKGKCLGAREAAAQARAKLERANGHLFMALVLIDEARRLARRVRRR